MNLDTFFEKFDLFADAPNAVAKMRELILDLAIKGQLVAQDPDEEGASLLLDAIQEKRLAIRAKSYGDVNSSEQPFQIPSNWLWVRLGNIALASDSGWSPQCESEPREGTNWGVLKVSAVSWGVFRPDENKALPSGMDGRSDCEVHPGDFLLSRANTADLVARSVIVRETPPRLMMSDKIVRFSLPDLVCKEFINIGNLCQSSREYYAKNASGTSSSMKNVGREVMCNLPIPLPPLAEQKRIVAKVDELMALCDRLEAQQQERETRHTALAQASLTRFADAPTPANLELLFHKSYSIEPAELRKSILTLAVRGKLVAQNFDDESPHNLLTRTSDSSVVENEYEIPPNWLWTSLEDIADIGTGSTPSRTESSFWSNGTVPWITSGATGKDVISSADEYVTHAAVKAHRLRIYPAGTLIVAMYGQGKTRGQVSVLGMESTINQACAAIGFPVNLADVRCYVRILLMKQYDEMRLLAAGGAQPNLNLQKIKEIKVPLPPLPEQKRIVAKVEQLMALVDRLEVLLSESRERAARLMDAVVAEIARAA